MARRVVLRRIFLSLSFPGTQRAVGPPRREHDVTTRRIFVVVLGPQVRVFVSREPVLPCLRLALAFMPLDVIRFLHLFCLLGKASNSDVVSGVTEPGKTGARSQPPLGVDRLPDYKLHASSRHPQTRFPQATCGKLLVRVVWAFSCSLFKEIDWLPRRRSRSWAYRSERGNVSVLGRRSGWQITTVTAVATHSSSPSAVSDRLERPWFGQFRNKPICGFPQPLRVGHWYISTPVNGVTEDIDANPVPELDASWRTHQCAGATESRFSDKGLGQLR
ncbi:hypothetical protein VTI74DRAFT_48 [Chaetomium olivicolor]